MSFSNRGGASDKASKVAHTWANKIKPEMYERGRETAYRIYFEGETIYSYGRHFPIACLHEKDGVTSVLFTNRSSTNTTNKHIRCASEACSQFEKILCYDPVEALRGNHLENLRHWEREAESKVNELAKARNKEARYLSILHFYNEAKAYADYFGFDLDLAEYPYLFARASKEFEAKIAQAKQAKEEKEREQRKDQIASYHKELELWKLFAVIQTEEGTWDYRTISLGADPMGFSYFRYNKNTERIETTQRVDIPLTAAKRFLTQICPAICDGKIVAGERILDYTLLEANKDFIRVGCHKISTEEIKRQALEMGWKVC